MDRDKLLVTNKGKRKRFLVGVECYSGEVGRWHVVDAETPAAAIHAYYEHRTFWGPTDTLHVMPEPARFGEGADRYLIEKPEEETSTEDTENVARAYPR